jgi:hypothetical protein
MARRFSAVMLALVLAGCATGGGEQHPQVPQRPMGSPPITLNLPTSRETQACFADLSREDVRFSPLPDRDFGGGCQQIGAVQLIDIGVPVTNLKGMRCELARTLVAWIRNGVEPAAQEILGGELVKVESFGTYSCRAIIGGGAESTGKISEHALANAVDISGFVLRDGRRITIEHDWHNPDPRVREFLDTIHRSACKRFATVLSPDYNAAHYNHLHLDMGRGPFCR